MKNIVEEALEKINRATDIIFSVIESLETKGRWDIHDRKRVRNLILRNCNHITDDSSEALTALRSGELAVVKWARVRKLICRGDCPLSDPSIFEPPERALTFCDEECQRMTDEDADRQEEECWKRFITGQGGE